MKIKQYLVLDKRLWIYRSGNTIPAPENRQVLHNKLSQYYYYENNLKAIMSREAWLVKTLYTAEMNFQITCIYFARSCDSTESGHTCQHLLQRLWKEELGMWLIPSFPCKHIIVSFYLRNHINAYWLGQIYSRALLVMSLHVNSSACCSVVGDHKNSLQTPSQTKVIKSWASTSHLEGMGPEDRPEREVSLELLKT